ncbi:MAG: hypothetical protein MZW92_11515 [Comamonadaceae bacterium]|nr:hypothetical protein [Comamonadaceae bacterium]
MLLALRHGGFGPDRVSLAGQGRPRALRRPAAAAGRQAACSEKRLGSANFIETGGAAYAMVRAQQNFPVTLYTGAGLQSRSARRHASFSAGRGVPYAEVQISSDAGRDPIPAGFRWRGDIRSRGHGRRPETEGLRGRSLDPTAGRCRLSEGGAVRRHRSREPNPARARGTLKPAAGWPAPAFVRS